MKTQLVSILTTEFKQVKSYVLQANLWTPKKIATTSYTGRTVSDMIIANLIKCISVVIGVILDYLASCAIFGMRHLQPSFHLNHRKPAIASQVPVERNSFAD